MPLIPLKGLPLALRTLILLFLRLSEAVLGLLFCEGLYLHYCGCLEALNQFKTFPFRVTLSLGKHPAPHLVNNGAGDASECFRETVFLSVGWQLSAVFTVGFFFITTCKDTDKRLQKCFTKWQNAGINVFKARGNLLRAICGNVPFMVMHLCLNIHQTF